MSRVRAFSSRKFFRFNGKLVCVNEAASPYRWFSPKFRRYGVLHHGFALLTQIYRI